MTKGEITSKFKSLDCVCEMAHHIYTVLYSIT